MEQPAPWQAGRSGEESRPGNTTMKTSATESLPFSPAATTQGAASRVARLVIGRVGDLLRILRHRRDVRHLLEMDERALKDIGVTRSDVLGALAQPVGIDPSIVLLVRSVEQRSRQRTFATPARVLSLPARARADA